MFTDIAGSTDYYTRRGDTAGRSKVRRHDGLVYPIAAEFGGEIIAHTGDGMLAIFDQPAAACRAALDMHHAIERDNAGIDDPDDELHIRIAIHAGVGLREQHNMYGNVINIASRIEQLADADRIVVSDAVLAALDEPLARRCVFFEERELRGTGRVLRMYELAVDAEALLAAREEMRVPARTGEAEQWRAAMHVDLEQAHELQERFPKTISAILGRFHNVVDDALDRWGGELVDNRDGVASALFSEAEPACHAAVEIMNDVAAEQWSDEWPEVQALSASAAVDAGPETMSEILAGAARLNSAGNAGHLLLTARAAVALGVCPPPGAEIRPLGTRVLQDHTTVESIYEFVPAGGSPMVEPLRTPGRIDPGWRVEVESDAPVRTVTEIIELLREGGAITLGPAQADELSRLSPESDDEYRLARLVRWSRPRYRIDTRFVELTMLVDRGEDAEGERWAESTRPIEGIGRLLSAVSEQVIVLLGPPGAGKSTMLRRLELETALRGLADHTAPVTLYLPLNQFRPEDDPARFAASVWAARSPQLAPLEEYVATGAVLVLADGLNEIPATSGREYRQSVRKWKDYVQRAVDSGNRFVFSCRNLDYSTPLSSPTLRVPQIRLEPMSNRQVRQYLRLYSPGHWLDIWTDIGGSGQLDMFRSPFFLRLLIDQVEAEGAIPKGRAGLFSGFVRQALKRELERDNPVFDDDDLLTSRDRRHIVAWQWDSPFELPAEGSLVPGLERLAYGMQVAREAGEASEVRIDYGEAVDLVGPDGGETVIDAGLALSILDESAHGNQVLFSHQLVQEYFAARHLAADPDFGLLAAPWARVDIDVPVEEEIAGLSPADPLPPLPGTGWEETAQLAAAMTEDVDGFLSRLSEVNLDLSGRCASQPEVGGRVRPERCGALRDQLFARSRDPKADLRARIAAGLTLGALGGPVFERAVGPFGEYLVPPVVPVEAGNYLIGSDEPYQYRNEKYYEEVPAAEVTIDSFSIGQFAVTNGEWAYFMAAGGYENPQFWQSEEALAWQQGRGTAVNIRRLARFWRDRFLADRDRVHDEYQNDHMDEAMFELWLRRLNMDDDEFEDHLRECYPEGVHTEPRHWRNQRFNNPMQPVIGISWFEAAAYAAWLSAQSGLPYRLPTEAEWEAAAGGRDRRRFAYGAEFDAMKGNTHETHVRGPTPVGVFPDGDTPDGVADMCGNTYDLTASLWGDDPLRTSWPYPYDPTDGREDPSAPITVSRVGMGGAWYLGEVHARTSYRGRDRYDLRPDDWLNYRGCRIALSHD